MKLIAVLLVIKVIVGYGANTKQDEARAAEHCFNTAAYGGACESAKQEASHSYVAWDKIDSTDVEEKRRLAVSCSKLVDLMRCIYVYAKNNCSDVNVTIAVEYGILSDHLSISSDIGCKKVYNENRDLF